MASLQTFRTGLPRGGVLLLCGVMSSYAVADTPRILQVSVPKSSSAVSLIREPASAPEITPAEPPPRTARRSAFVPITVPESSSMPQAAPAPELPSQPTFPAEPARPAASAALPSSASPANSWQPSGPALAPPTAEPSSPQIPSPVSRAQPPPVSYQAAPQTSHLTAGSTSPSAALQAVADRALSKAEQASQMAQRGMLYSAQTELLAALSLIAQALDVEKNTSSHAQALAAGLTAVEEARDFAMTTSQASASVDVPTIAAGHRTALFKNDAPAPRSPVIAQQQYFGYAQDRIAHAAGQVPAASQILYRLGRLQTALAAHDADPLALHGPQAIVFHQAAIMADRGNWLAANELGVLYARYGQLPAAKEMLLASVTMHSHVAGWQNLAAVHRRMGEDELASRAEWERQSLAAKKPAAAGTSEIVRWVDAQTFAGTGKSDVRWPADVAAKPATADGTTRK